MTFRHWENNCPPGVEICPVQLPGRGSRLKEPAFNSLPALVQALGPALLPYFDKPFAFFGHSMGASVGFELARLLRENGQPQPLHLFVSGRRASQIPARKAPLYNLPEAELLDGLHRLNGTPKEFMEHPELIQMMLPLLRADFSVAETYVYTPGPPLDCPITAFGGLEDGDVSREDIEGWREHTSNIFKVRMFPGDHFFINTSQQLLLQVLFRELHELTRQVA
jgi:medium-chain acyl-[acyl-carrier-protein] hydrolase